MTICFPPPPLLTGQQFDDLLHLVLEADVEDAVGLVDDQALQVLEEEAGACSAGGPTSGPGVATMMLTPEEGRQRQVM